MRSLTAQAITVVQLLSYVQLFVTPMDCSTPGFPVFTISQSLLKFMSTELAILSNHLILCNHLLLPSIFPSIMVFSNESPLHIRWPNYWSLSFSICPSNEYSELIFLDWSNSLQSKGLSRVFSITIWKHRFFGVQPSLWSNFSIHTWLLEKP